MKRRGRPPHPDVLTPREWEVHALLREGYYIVKAGRPLPLSRARRKKGGQEGGE